MTIRPAQSKDAKAIAKIWNEIIHNTSVTFTTVEKTIDDIEVLICERTKRALGFYVAETFGGVQGFATYGPFRSGSGYAHTMEHTVMIARRARGQGLGKALMKVLENHAHRNGIRCLIAGIGHENKDGILFHQAIGFHKVATLKQVGFKFDRWHDLILMQKHL